MEGAKKTGCLDAEATHMGKKWKGGSEAPIKKSSGQSTKGVTTGKTKGV